MRHLQIELTNHCQLFCSECVNRFMRRKRTHMSEDVFNVILAKYIEQPMQPETVILSKDGEPLLCPNIREYIKKICNVSKAKIVIYTNGLLLTEDFIIFLNECNNHFQMLVSFHYEQTPGKDMIPIYNKVEETLMKCINMKFHNIDFVVTSHILSTSDEMLLKRWENRWKIVKNHCPQLTGVHLNSHINHWTKLIEEGNVKFDNCPYGDGEHLFIGNTGNILPCCMTLEEGLTIGTINDDPTMIFEKQAEFYKNLSDGIKPELCERCLS